MLIDFPTESYIYRSFGQKDKKIRGYTGKQEIAGCETLYIMDNIHPTPGDTFIKETSGETFVVRGYSPSSLGNHCFIGCTRCLIEKIIGDTAERR